MAAYLLVRRRREERVYRERVNPMDVLRDRQILERYRLSREAIEYVHTLIEMDISSRTLRNHAVPSMSKLLATLRYLAKGDFYSEVGDLHGISRSSVSKFMSKVIDAINRKLFITFPMDGQDLMQMKAGFYKIAGMPNVVGAIDGTLIPIIAPRNDEESFICRKGYHALNIQAVVNHQMRFIDVVAPWPGSTHDSTIFENCGLKQWLGGTNNNWLLGDSGYGLKPYIMTPVGQPTTQSEMAYNIAHIKTRLVVEKAFGILKSRFRCLHKSGGYMLFTPVKAASIVTACMKLNNLCMDMNVPNPPILEDEDHDDHLFEGPLNANGLQVRQSLINRF